MNASEISQYIINTFAGVETSKNFGYTFFFQGTDRMLPFATLISADNEYDRISRLDRPGVYRLNMGIARAKFQALLGSDKINPGDYDYSVLNTFMPHPEYYAQYWLCVLSPRGAVLDRTRELLAEAHALAVQHESRPRA